MKTTDFETKIISSPLGPITLSASVKGLRRVDLNGTGTALEAPAAHKEFLEKNSAAQNWLRIAESQLHEYFAQQRQGFEITLDLQGTDFQKKIWRALQEIPWGETCSYQDIAIKIKSRGYQAIGSAIGKNPLCIIIPCHRVINKNGQLGGYSGGGIENKIFLLDLEQQ